MHSDYLQARAIKSKVVNMQTMVIDVRWQPPATGWVILDTYGAARDGGVVDGCGGVLRKADGAWLSGFSKHIGQATAYEVELWGVHEGLLLAQACGFTCVKLSLDANVFVQGLNGSTQGSVLGLQLLMSIKKIMAGDWLIRIWHVYRETNKVADALASLGCQLTASLLVYDALQDAIRQLLVSDAMGVSTPRCINV